ncbi:MAG: cytidylate kinase [Bacteroidetes bacterium ADurb.Bin217]|nr:MAG: cytidylate kinase [Bacteroidetes bacterium ADurb.Bin217]
MESVFLQYMNDRLKMTDRKPKTVGPVITISREYGCYGSEIAQLLIEKINAHKVVEAQWEMISNVVLNKVAQNLKVNPSQISHVFGAEVKSTIEDFFTSFAISKRYVSDENVIRHISDIVTSYANKGRVVIVGRAGCVLAKHIPKSLHVKLVAPLSWRANRVAKRFDISMQDALKKVGEIDEKRSHFMNFYDGNRPESELFDVIFNRSTLTTEQIVNQMYSLAEDKGII